MNSLNRMISIGAGLVLMVLLSGCLEIKMNTRVNRDGSLVRTQILSGDSAEVLNHRFPTLIDKSWTITVTSVKEPEAEKGWRRAAEKTFSTADEMNGESPAGLSLRVRAVFEKRFRWFFTEYFYKETYLCYSPFTTIPMSQFVTQAELDRFYRHEMDKEPYASPADSLSMKEAGNRFAEWRARNIFETFYLELKNGVVALHDASLPVSLLEERKEELFENTKELYTSSGNVDTLLTIAQYVLGSRAVPKAAEMNERGFASLREKLDFVDDVAHSLQATITMPGLIIDSNAPTVEGNTAFWKNVDAFAYISDFDVWVKSRVVNWWAVVVGGVVVLGALVLLIVGAIRRRSVPAA